MPQGVNSRFWSYCVDKNDGGCDQLSQARNQRPTLFPISIARSIVRPLEAAVNYIIRQIPMLMRETLNVASELAVAVDRCKLI